MAERKITVFLQNTWNTVYAGGIFPRPIWYPLFLTGRTAKSLGRLIDLPAEDDLTVWNTTEICGDKPSSKLPPDPQFVSWVLEDRKPELVITCGLQARETVSKLWTGDLICVPHPAYRFMHPGIFKVGRFLIENNVHGRFALWENKGEKFVRINPVDDHARGLQK